MANPETQAYEDGRKLAAGWISTDQVPLSIDTYYQGMPLAYSADGTVVDGATNTGNGTVTAVTAASNVPAGEYTLTFTGALTAQLTGPGGAILINEIDLADGDAVTVNYMGLEFTITDGATAFAATDSFVITVPTTGEYAYSTGTPDAIYNGPEGRVLSAAGVGDVIVSGEISEAGLVDDAGDALTITEAQKAAWALAGFYLKEE